MNEFEDTLEKECLKQIKVRTFTHKIITKQLIKSIENYENPFVGERFSGHEYCYKEIEKLRKFILKRLK
jgi:hypothetical protein